MKKLMIIMLAVVSFFMTACNDNVKSKKEEKTTSTGEQTSTEKDVQQFITEPCPQFTLNGIRHNGAVHTLIYDGALRLFDYSLLDGYVLMGIIYDDSNGTNNTPSFEFQSNYYSGTPVLYNSEKNAYILWRQTDRAWLKVTEHICEDDCVKTAD